MIARASQLFLPTLRDAPADAEAASHQLLVRGGLLRLREFIMKDSYTFDADEAGLDAAFDRHEKAYARIFERCGLEAYLVEAESGVMGGKSSLGYLAPTGSGENELMRCENGDYFADAEAARGAPPPPDLPPP